MCTTAKGMDMARTDDLITTYLTACEVEGKSPLTVASYAASLKDLRRIGAREGFPEDPRQYTVAHVYEFLRDVRSRGATPAYQHRRHREVKAFLSWCRRGGSRQRLSSRILSYSEHSTRTSRRWVLMGRHSVAAPNSDPNDPQRLHCGYQKEGGAAPDGDRAHRWHSEPRNAVACRLKDTTRPKRTDRGRDYMPTL